MGVTKNGEGDDGNIAVENIHKLKQVLLRGIESGEPLFAFNTLYTLGVAKEFVYTRDVTVKCAPHPSPFINSSAS